MQSPTRFIPFLEKHSKDEPIHSDSDQVNASSPIESELTPAAVSAPPDSGFHAWLQVVGVFFCWFNSWGLSNSFGVFQTYYERNLPQSSSQISWIGSLQALLLIGVGVFTGPAYDAGYLRELIWAGTLLVPFGFMMTSLATEYWQIMLAQGVVVGIGFGCLFTPSVSILPQYFQKRRALANGLAASGASFGGTIYPILFHRLLTHTPVGFPWAVRILAFLVLATSLVSALILKARFPPPKSRILFDLHAVREPPFALLTIALFFALVGIYVPTFYIQLYALKSKTPPILSGELPAYILPILNAAAIPGRVVPGLITNTTGVLNLWIILLASASLLTLCWIAVADAGGLVAFALVYGFCFGGILSLPPVAIVSLSPDLSAVGTRSGTCFALASLGVLIGTPIGGVILNKGGDGRGGRPDFLGLQVFGGVVMLVSAAFCVGARVCKVGWSVKSKA